MTSSSFPQDLSDSRSDCRPSGLFVLELFAAGRCDLVNASPAFVFGCHPFGPDPTSLFQAVECGVERALLDAKLLGYGLNLGRDSVTMERSAAVKNFED
jgi:hypothetical protein